jgi:arsenite methyltransferase
MTNNLNETIDFTDPDLASIYDELPLWSSYFGARMLEVIKYRKNITALDVGCGAGFPLFELAQRLGCTSKVIGIDPWPAVCKRIELKLRTMKIKNVVFLNQPAESLLFEDSFFDLIVSNNGLNNVQDPEKVLSECFRTIKPGGQFVITVNLPGTMAEFYNIFNKVLIDKGMTEESEKIETHIKSKRKSVEENIQMLERNNFQIKNVIEDSFFMRFADGTAFLNHYFIKIAFLDSWKKIPAAESSEDIFSNIETALNKLADRETHLKLTIPYAVFDCSKV